jgi:hypothetical protein
MKHFITAALVFASFLLHAQTKFSQLGTELPTPNVYRTASGAPGHEYYQQKADYVIDVRLDDSKQRIDGKETITYTNNSPDAWSTYGFSWIKTCGPKTQIPRRSEPCRWTRGPVSMTSNPCTTNLMEVLN